MRQAKRPRTPDARDLAVQTLLRLDGSQQPVQAALNAVLAHSACGKAEAALCAEICYGTLRMEIRLLWLLSRFLKSPDALPPRMRCILLVAAYALLFLTGMPDHAAVDWAVESVKRNHGQRLAGVANACLRAICREGTAPDEYAYYHAEGRDEQAQLALYYSLPLWIVRLWQIGYGPDKSVQMMAKSATRPAMGLRVNRVTADWEELARQLEHAGALRLSAACYVAAAEHRGRLEDQCSLALMHEQGRLSRQGAASQLALYVLRPESWPEPIWDACAGQGTKCCALLELSKEVRLASDTHWPRVRRISGECRRLGLPQPLVARASALNSPTRFRPGAIVLDVPCSGLGVLRSRPDIRRRRQASQLHELLRVQAGMLETAYAELALGGHIAYISCAQNPAENELQIRAFLGRHPDAQLVLEWNSPAEDSLLEGMYSALIVKG